MVVLFRRVALLTAHRCTPSAGWSGFDTLEPARWVGGTGAMSSGLEDGLDSISAFVNEMNECPMQATAS